MSRTLATRAVSMATVGCGAPCARAASRCEFKAPRCSGVKLLARFTSQSMLIQALSVSASNLSGVYSIR